MEENEELNLIDLHDIKIWNSDLSSSFQLNLLFFRDFSKGLWIQLVLKTMTSNWSFKEDCSKAWEAAALLIRKGHVDLMIKV